ncbi:MAG: pro-sigmaK processing inhibitor BofA family protein [Bacilli bacterium]|jgi:hypothetical protein
MIKFVFKFLKKLIFSSFLLYGYNILALPINVIIPINIITILIITILGIPALFALILIHVLIY